MVKWKISEAMKVSETRSEIFIYSPSNKKDYLNRDNLKNLINNDDFVFNLVYSSSKMIGYHFEYNNPSVNRHTITDRMISWFFDGEKKEPQVNILFEDQNIRLLSYVSKDNNLHDKVDYWLVGRWRDVE